MDPQLSWSRSLRMQNLSQQTLCQKKKTIVTNASFAFQYVYLDTWTPVEKVTVTLGGKEFSYGKRRNNSRCLLVCIGLTGLDASGKWSTWSPGHFKIPENDEDFVAAIPATIKAYLGRPKFKAGYFI